MLAMYLNVLVVSTKLGDAFVAAYPYHDAPSNGHKTRTNAKTLAVVSEDITFEQLNALAELEELPQIVSADLFPFLLEIDPVLKAQINGRPVPHQEEIAHFAAQALQASAALRNPSHLPQLQKLADSFGVTGTPLEQLIGITEMLEQSVDETVTPARDDTPPEIPELRAFYEEIDMAIVVLPDAAAIGRVDWVNVERVFGRKFSTLLITTTALLPLLAQYDLAIPFAIDRFRHKWGANIILALNVPLQNLLRNAAQHIFTLGTTTFPHLIVCTPAEKYGTLIHNIQNQLLKTQFQFELLSMIYELPDVSAPRLSAERSLPNEQRIANIRQHLVAWLALYRKLLQTVGGEQ